jgi:predicted RND superfamily exporter protein
VNNILKFPKLILLGIVLLTILFSGFATKLEIDASADTLLLDGDKDLALTRQLGKRYEAPDILVITYTPKWNLLDDKTLDTIENISKELSSLEATQNVTSILTVPLLQSPVRPIKELLNNIPTLKSPNIDKALVKKELLSSALYKQNLVSKDFKTTAILINLKSNLSKEINHQNIINLRAIITKYTNSGTLYLGGVSMIADDMVEFVKQDLKTFGIVIFGLLIVILFILFREIKWILIPLLICTVSVILTSGMIYLLGWKISVISSNFISLLLIMNMSLVVHLAVKYLELLHKNINHTQYQLVLETISSMAKPSFFVVITTIAGFSSLVLSGIVPIIDFGWMMSIGITISLILTFIMLPSILVLLPKSIIRNQDTNNKPFTTYVAQFVQSNQKLILISWIFIILFSITGAMKIFVENSFIDYFKKDTEIYKGMKVLDQQLGGTTPLDIVLTFKDDNVEVETIVNNTNTNSDDEMLDEFDDEMEAEDESASIEQYWFTSNKMETIKKVHEYLDGLEATGKVLSLHTVATIGKVLNNNQDLDSITLALLYSDFPENYKKILLDPYVNIEYNQVRFSTRIIDSQKDLRRNNLLIKINKDLNDMLNPKFEEFKVTNLLVIYNNMLQSLFDSQIKTIGVVIFMLLAMFIILFKDLKLALIAIVANTAPVSVIFGFMGWMQIPLDMMTITIASISIGIAVDNTIHYIHRYTYEYNNSQDYISSMFNAHSSIGKAMFYTSLIIMIGFSVLVLSSFIPTIYFGLLTLLAMFMAIAADLLLLPAMLLLFKPFKKKN